MSAAWFGWAAVTLSATTIFHSFTVYPDGVGGVIALTGVWALLRAEEERRTGDARLLPWLLHGLALALLPWLHSRFALLAGSIGALVLLRLSVDEEPGGEGGGVSLGARVRARSAGWDSFARSMASPIPRRPTAPRAISRSPSFPAGLPGCSSISGSD